MRSGASVESVRSGSDVEFAEFVCPIGNEWKKAVAIGSILP